MKNKKINLINSGGYTVVELLFYMSIFVILVLVVINAMIIMTKSFRETTIHAQLISTNSIMERMSREIRQALSINSISATDLVLNTKDLAGAAKTVEFVLSGSNINFLENSVSTGNLNSSNIAVSSLSFTQITTTAGKAVKISMTLNSTKDTLGRNVDFYNTIGLRGSY